MNRFTWTFIVVCTCNNWPSSNFAFISSTWGEAGQQQIASNFLWTEHFDCRTVGVLTCFDTLWKGLYTEVHWGADGPQLSGQDAIQVLADVYANWVPRDRILTTNLWSLGRCIQQLSRWLENFCPAKVPRFPCCPPQGVRSCRNWLPTLCWPNVSAASIPSLGGQQLGNENPWFIWDTENPTIIESNQIGCSNMLCINRYRGDQYVYYVWGFHTCLNRSRWLCWHSCPWLWSEALLGMGKWAWTEDDKSRRSNMYRCRLYESPRYWMVESWASANFQTTFSGPRISGMNSLDVKSLQLLVGLRLFDSIAF